MSSGLRQRGFTFAELMIVVALLAVLAKLAAPPMAQFIQSSQLNAAANQFHADLQVARREAIKRNNRVLVCPRASATATTCLTTITATTNWGANGWLVCYDYDQDGACDTAPSDGSNPNPIRIHSALDSTLTITGVAAKIRFNANGTQGDGSSAPKYCTQGTWTGTKVYKGEITQSGHIALAKPPDGTQPTCS